MDRARYFGWLKEPDYIDPKEGFHFESRDGELEIASTNNANYSAALTLSTAEYNRIQMMSDSDARRAMAAIIKQGGTDVWNGPGGKVVLADKTIVMSPESHGNGKRRTRIIDDLHEFKLALVALKKFGVTNEFTLTNVQHPFKGLTVGEVLALPDHVTAELDSVKKAELKKLTKGKGDTRIVQDFEAFTKLAAKADLEWPDQYWHESNLGNGVFWVGGQLEPMETEDEDILTFKDRAILFGKLLVKRAGELMDDGVDVRCVPNLARDKIHAIANPSKKAEHLDELRDSIDSVFGKLSEEAKFVNLNILVMYP
jgi:hypothetical protein